METSCEEDEHLKRRFEDKIYTDKGKNRRNEEGPSIAETHIGRDREFHDSLAFPDRDENESDLEKWADIPIGDGTSSREDLASLEEAISEADGPLLTLAAEVLSLIQDPWSQVISSGRSLFLSDRLLQQDVQIRLSIGLRYAEPTN